MNHIDLFSGIGGFALAARTVWGDEYHNLFFCDNNKFCQYVLKKNFGKDSLIYGDIREVTTERVIADTANARIKEVRQEWQNEVFLLTGGFPCQPFSCAGKRKGTNDDRYLWPEMLRVIQDFKPTWIIAENVRGLLTIEGGLVFEQVCIDLERESYEVQPFIIPACAVNAPHRRDRVWIVANRKSKQSRKSSKQKGWKDIGGRDCNATYSRQELWGTREQEYRKLENKKSSCNNQRCCEAWNQNWLKVATELCRMDDGFHIELDGFKLTKSRHRVERLKSLGNAIVPQVAIEIMIYLKQRDKK